MPIPLEFKYRPILLSLATNISLKMVLQPEVMWKKLPFPWWDCGSYLSKALLDDLEVDFYLLSTLPRLSHVPFTTNKCKKGLVACDPLLVTTYPEASEPGSVTQPRALKGGSVSALVWEKYQAIVWFLKKNQQKATAGEWETEWN